MVDIQDDQNIARYCDPRKLTEDGRVTGACYQLRPRDRGKLSVNWLEYIECETRKAKIDYLIHHYSTIMNEFKGAKVAVSCVGKTKDYVYTESLDDRKLSIAHIGKPGSGNPSHACISNITLNEMVIFELIAKSVSVTYDFPP